MTDVTIKKNAMKRLFLIFTVIAATAVAAHSQYKVNADGNSMIVTGKDGQQIINIVPERQNDKLSLEVLGFRVKLGDKEKGAASSSLKRGPGSGKLGFIEVGINEIRYADYSMYPEASRGFIKKYDWRSWHFGMTFLNLSFKLNASGTIAFTTGWQGTFHTFGVDKHFALTGQDGMLTPVKSDEPYKSSMIIIGGFRFPFQLDFNLKNGIFASLGVFVDMTGGDAVVRKPAVWSGRPYFNNIQTGLSIKVGYRSVYIYTDMPMLDMFKSGRGPLVAYNTVGLGFIF